jgi:methionine-rich copper-binding protein CopC
MKSFNPDKSMYLSLGLTVGNHLVRLLAVACVLLGGWSAQTAPTIVSTVPANMATGVSPTAPIVFTFSEAMNTDPNVTTVDVIDTTGYQLLTTSLAWSSGNMVLTCSPATSWPANHTIVWSADGENAGGTTLGGNTAGMFTTAAGAAGTGCDTNASMLSFTVSKGWMYEQASTGMPALNTNSPYCFLACMSLPCPRNATNVSLQWLAEPPQNMALSPIPGHPTLTACGYANQATFEATYPPADYTFNVQSTSSNQQVTVNLPPTLSQPAAPHLTNYLAAQSIDPAQPFSLGWDAFPGGTTADCIYVEIYGGVFQTPALGMAGALSGTATSVVIPAGTLQANQQYSGCVSFYHYQMLTNGASYISLTYRCSTTEFNLRTVAGSAFCPVITNPGWEGTGVFKFEVACPISQPLVAEWSTNLHAGPWQPFCTTNSGGYQRVKFTDPTAGASARQFYRVRTGQ